MNVGLLIIALQGLQLPGPHRLHPIDVGQIGSLTFRGGVKRQVLHLFSKGFFKRTQPYAVGRYTSWGNIRKDAEVNLYI